MIARSAFHNSFRYRSCVIFGTASLIPDDRATEKRDALQAITNHPFRNLDLPANEKDRWNDCREVTDTELRSTRVIEVNLEMASAKVSTGGPGDDKKDLEDDEVRNKWWAGEVVKKTGWESTKNSGVGVTAAVPRYIEKLVAESI